MTTRSQLSKRRFPCVIGSACKTHYGVVHGKEAEELRSGIEEIMHDLQITEHDNDSISTLQELPSTIIEKLQDLLDEVDARDSLAYLEATDKKTKKAHDEMRAADDQ